MGTPITLGNFYPLVPQSHRNFHWPSLWGGGRGEGYELCSRITRCLSTGLHPLSSLSSRFFHPFPKQRAFTGYPWGLRKNYDHSVLVYKHNYSSVIYLLYQEMDSKQNRIRLSSIAFDWFDNRTHSKIYVRLWSITEPNRTIGIRLGSIESWFDFARLDMSRIIWRRGGLTALHVAVGRFKFLH